MTLTRDVVRHELVRRDLEVVRTTPLSATMVRITLGGGELEGFAADGPADHIRVLFPATERFAAATRDYTPLASRVRELDIDFVLHGPDRAGARGGDRRGDPADGMAAEGGGMAAEGGGEGPASAWAASAAVGDRLTIGGPRGSRLVPTGMTRLVIVADATALPAAARWLALTPAGVPITVLLRVTDVDAGYLDPALADLRRVASDAELEPALRALAPFDETTYLFLAGEAGALVPLRRYLRRELGLPAEQVQASGYWRRGVAGLDHHAPIDPDDPD